MSVIKDLHAGKITMDALNDELDGDFKPVFFRYIGATAAGHKAILEDFAENRILFESEANGANYTDILPYVSNRSVNGFKLTTLGSGKVEIYLK